MMENKIGYEKGIMPVLAGVLVDGGLKTAEMTDINSEKVRTEEMGTEKLKTEKIKTEEIKTEEIKTEEMNSDELKTKESKTEEILTKNIGETRAEEKEAVRCNHMEIVFDALSENEGFARMAVASFILSANPTVEEMEDVKTAVSEAVTNGIIHGYRMNRKKEMMEIHPKIVLRGNLKGKCLQVEVEDFGVGIKDINLAMQPLYTTRPELERSGMGFAFMMCFMDEVLVESQPDVGTKITMCKTFGMEE